MNLFPGFLTASRNGVPMANKAGQLERRMPVVDKTTTSLDFTILGLKRQEIETVKQEIKKCCQQESSDILVDGEEYSNIIKFLDQYQVFCVFHRNRNIP